MKIASLFLFALLFVFYSCHKKNASLVETHPKRPIKPKQQEELYKIIHHYAQKETDSLKLKAALFLIQDMSLKYYYTSYKLDEFDTLFTILGAQSEEWKKNIPWYGNQVHQLIDSLETKYGYCCGVLQKQYDLDHIDSRLIIENIDLAFLAWSKPWSKHYTFEQFCEYILPYRSTSEKLESWRSAYSNRLSRLIGNPNDTTSVLALAQQVNDVSQLYYQDGINRYPTLISPSNLLKTSFADCRSIANFKLLNMRSIGIATSVDFTPQWANGYNGHYWNSLFDDHGKAINFMVALHDVQAQTAYNWVLPKVYRYTYSANPKVLKLLHTQINNTPEFFKNPCYTDVTDEYVKTTSLTIQTLPQKKLYKYVFLCLFNNGFNAIDFAEIDANGIARFEKVGGNTCYFLMYYDKGQFIKTVDPFILNTNAKQQTITCDTVTKQTMILHRKCQMEIRKENWLKSLVSAEIQFSNDKNFRKYTLAHKISTQPSQYMETISVNGERSYRYARFLFSPEELQIQYWGDGASLAELSFYDKQGKQLTGTISGSLGKSYNNYTAEKVFDNNPLTFFEDARTSGQKYVTLDFGKPQLISECKYQARNDMNNVQIGDEYELLYFDGNQFTSLGKQKATDHALVYSKAPTKTIYWLKNLSNGKEERIFTYENGQQVWW